MANKTQYSDEFRAGALLFLDAAGYPEREGALSRAGRELQVPLSTLRGWYTQEHNPVPTKLRKRKKLEFTTALQNEIDSILEQMDTKRCEASYRDLGTVFGILVDKKQLVTGKATQRVGHIREMLESLPEDEYNDIVAEAEAIIATACESDIGDRQETQS